MAFHRLEYSLYLLKNQHLNKGMQHEGCGVYIDGVCFYTQVSCNTYQKLYQVDQGHPGYKHNTYRRCIFFPKVDS